MRLYGLKIPSFWDGVASLMDGVSSLFSAFAPMELPSPADAAKADREALRRDWAQIITARATTDDWDTPEEDEAWKHLQNLP